jgi:Family of unknown function (DUF6088)
VQSLESKIISRVYGHGRGWAFSKIDFLDLAPGSTVDNALSRFLKRGTIRRILAGLYDYPRHSTLLGEDLDPDMRQAADAIARQRNWSVVPEGATALHLLGLSQQVPARYAFLSSGPNQTFEISGMKLEFHHRKTQHTGIGDRKSAVLVQAINAIGEGRITPDQKIHLSRLHSADEYRKIVRRTVTATTWIHDNIKEIAQLAGLRDDEG